jgi:hypothetical protein
MLPSGREEKLTLQLRRDSIRHQPLCAAERGRAEGPRGWSQADRGGGDEAGWVALLLYLHNNSPSAGFSPLPSAAGESKLRDSEDCRKIIINFSRQMEEVAAVMSQFGGAMTAAAAGRKELGGSA